MLKHLPPATYVGRASTKGEKNRRDTTHQHTNHHQPPPTPKNKTSSSTKDNPRFGRRWKRTTSSRDKTALRHETSGEDRTRVDRVPSIPGNLQDHRPQTRSVSEQTTSLTPGPKARHAGIWMACFENGSHAPSRVGIMRRPCRCTFFDRP